LLVLAIIFFSFNSIDFANNLSNLNDNQNLKSTNYLDNLNKNNINDKLDVGEVIFVNEPYNLGDLEVSFSEKIGSKINYSEFDVNGQNVSKEADFSVLGIRIFNNNPKKSNQFDLNDNINVKIYLQDINGNNFVVKAQENLVFNRIKSRVNFNLMDSQIMSIPKSTVEGKIILINEESLKSIFVETIDGLLEYPLVVGDLE
jgi:hypothetical protein